MAFDPKPQVQRTATKVRTITVELFYGLDEEDSSYGDRYARFEARVDDQFGQPMNWRRGDLIPHLTTAQRNQLIAFMNILRTKAESEILP